LGVLAKQNKILCRAHLDAEAAVDSGHSTCWALVHDAAAGDVGSRGEFGLRYAPVVRSYLAARWRGSNLLAELDDAVQEVFLECIRQGGVLERAQDDRPGGFRAFLFGAVRNVALRFEKQRARRGAREAAGAVDLAEFPNHEETLSKVFDRALARSIMREAAARQAALASARGDDACRRVELLKLRFQEGLPVREIAALWHADAAELHREYAKARQEFHAALREVVGSHLLAGPESVEYQCAQLLALLE
jgi:RNA polymerase sigma-70 factor (ECF subfamily)